MIKKEVPETDVQHGLLFVSKQILIKTEEGWNVDWYFKEYESSENGLKLIKEGWLNTEENILEWGYLP